jgi:Flp pilus assembly pilin Flp
MMQIIRHGHSLLVDERGAAGGEFAALAALVALVIVATTCEIGLTLYNAFQAIFVQLADALRW